MVNQENSGGLASQGRWYQELQLQLEEAFNEDKISQQDPVFQLVLEEFIKQHEEARSILQTHQGRVSGIINKLDELGISEQKIVEFCKQILQIQKGEAAASIIPSKQIKNEAVQIECFFDINAPDHNGIILQDLNRAIEEGGLIVTTRALFKARHIKGNSYTVFEKFKREKLLRAIENRYDIFTNGAYLVFIPKKIGNHLSDLEKLARLDFDSSTLSKISLGDAWTLTEEKASIEGFVNLFSTNACRDKFILISGHGGVGNPAGLNSKDYRHFLKWAKAHRCKALIVSSCFAGGQSTQLHLPEKSEQLFEKPVFEGITYPVIVRSVGDMPTFGAQEAEKNTQIFFTKLADLLNLPGGNTLLRLRELLQEHEGGASKKPVNNLVQVYFPVTGDSPSGFHPVGEGGESYPLTFAHYRKNQIGEGVIKIEGKSYLEVSPIIIETKVEFKGKNPIILSMISGKAHHMFKEITLDNMTPENFLIENYKLYKEAKIGVKKALFIESLETKEIGWKQVFIDLEKGDCGYRFHNDHFLWNANNSANPIKITPFQFLLRCNRLMEDTRPLEESVRAATGGQQSNDSVIKGASEGDFWGNRTDALALFQHLIMSENIGEFSLQEVKDLLTEAEQISLIGYLLFRNPSLACDFFRCSSLSPDSKDELGIPLLIEGVRSGSVNFVEELIAKGANLNIQEPENLETALHTAFRKRDTQMINFLLSQSPIDLEMKNGRNIPTFFASVLFSVELLNKCLQLKPTLNFNSELNTKANEKLNLLAAAVIYGSTKAVEFLLAHGADPNSHVGEVSPLGCAIIGGDKEKISLLLKYGADPYDTYPHENSPIIEAIKRCSVDVVEELLKVEIKNKGFKEGIKQSPFFAANAIKQSLFFAAFQSGEENKIRLLLNHPFIFPALLGPKECEAFEEGLHRLLLFGKEQVIVDVLNKFGKKCPQLLELVRGVRKMRKTSQST